MSIRKQYSFPSELSLQKEEPTYVSRPTTSPIPKPRPTTDPIVKPRPTTDPIVKPRPTTDFVPRPSGGGGGFIPPKGTDGNIPDAKNPTGGDALGGDAVKKVDWLPIILIGVGAIIFVMKPFK